MNHARMSGADLDWLDQPVTLLTALRSGSFFSSGAEPDQGRPPLIVQLRTQRVTVEQLRQLLARDPVDAARWISSAARAGFPAAQVVWGQLLLDGRGVARNPSVAFNWFEIAAAAGDAEARNMVGRCYEQGWGVPSDPQLATKHFELAAQAGHIWGQVNLAQMLMRAGDPADRPRCFALFKAAAESGTTKPHLKAMNSYARFLEEGWAGPPDLALAAHWYLRAAKLGDHWAQYNLATLLFRQGDQKAADQLLRNAVAISDNGFRRRIAPLLLARPEVVLRQRGLDALALCAEGNAPEDLYAYGLALDEGVAGASDPDKAAALFKAAAAQGYAQAIARIRSKNGWCAIRRLAGRALRVARCFPELAGNTSLSRRRIK